MLRKLRHFSVACPSLNRIGVITGIIIVIIVTLILIIIIISFIIIIIIITRWCC